MTENSRMGREPIEVVQIDQDYCAHTYGNSPCTASLATGGDKCFNTRKTCQDPANYLRGTLTLNFCKNQARLPQDGNYYFPFLLSVKHEPGAINAGGGASSLSALGLRSGLTATFSDHPHNDRIVDPYLDERSYDPFERATFWTKWRARNPYYAAREIRLIRGYLDSDGAIVDSITQTYFIEKLQGPGATGAVKIMAKDVLSFAQDKKAQAPAPSAGKLLSDITAGAGTLTLTPAGAGDEGYDTSGWVRIGGEVIEYTRSGGSDILTLVTRGDYNTVAAAHSGGDLVQKCLIYDGESPSDILYSLLNTYAAIDASYLDKTGWDAEVASFLPRLYGAIITEPTGVAALVSEITEQMGFYVWWDDRNNLVRMRAIRPAEDDTVYPLTRELNLIADNVSVSDQPEKRLTQVWVYHALRDPTKDLEEAQNYGALERVTNSKGDRDLYATDQVKVIYSRWISGTNAAAAVDVGNQNLARAGDTPREVKFALDAKDREVWVGDFCQVTTRQIVDQFGQYVPLNVQVLRATEDRPGDSFQYVGQEFVFDDPPDSGDLQLIISSDENDVNLRDVYDNTIGVSPTGVIRFVIRSNVEIGSTLGLENPALATGDWPVDVDLYLTIEEGAVVQGKGGDGGQGGSLTSKTGEDGGDGGRGLLVTNAITINNLGTIAGGGGGGGGGGFASYQILPASRVDIPGGGGGGGSGVVGGAGGAAGTGASAPDVEGNAGSAGRTLFGGQGGQGLRLPAPMNFRTGSGGRGGTALSGTPSFLNGADGSDGREWVSGATTQTNAGGSAGLRGTAVREDGSLITWENQGDIRGDIVSFPL